MSGENVLSKLLASEVRGELLSLFHRNPGLIDTIEGIARRIGRTPGLIEADLRALVELGVLTRKKMGSSEVIRLDRLKDKEVLDSVANQISLIELGGHRD